MNLMKSKRAERIITKVLTRMARAFVGIFLMATLMWGQSSIAHIEDVQKFPMIEIGAWGFIDKQGKYVISPRFNAGTCFENGLARVRYGKGASCNSQILIDKKGNRVMPPEKESGVGERSKVIAPPLFFMTTDDARLGEFADGVAIRSVVTQRLVPNWAHLWRPSLVYVGQRFYLVDKSGVTIKELPGEPIREKFSDGLLPVRIDSKVGFVDTKGELVIKNQFYGAFQFKDGLGWVAKGSDAGPLWGCIDKAGKIVVPYMYKHFREFHDERAFVTLANKKQGFIDRAGHMVITQAMDTTYNDFSDGVASFTTKDTHGFIDKSGKIICTLKMPAHRQFQRWIVRRSH